MKHLLSALLMLPGVALAGDLSVSDPWIPLAPPSAKAHAAYFTLTNDGAASRHLIGVAADGYRMAHLHQSTETDGVAMMHGVDQLSIAPGQSISFEPGGLHVMLMMPMAAPSEGAHVPLTLLFANGDEIAVEALVRRPYAGS